MLVQKEDTLLTEKATVSSLSGVQSVAAATLAALQQTASLSRVLAAADLMATKQALITVEAPLPQSHVDNLVGALAGKQPTLGDDDLQISHVSQGCKLR